MAAGQTFGDEYKLEAGITQGSPISPTMWSVIADGLIRYVQARCPHIGPITSDGLRVSILMFADDIKLLATSSSDLQTLLDVVKDWCDLLNLIVNAIKTHVLIFPEPVAQTCPELRHDGAPLVIVPSTKYLGLLFSSKAGMGESFTLLHGNMWGAWSSLLRQYGNLRSTVSIGLLLQLLLTCVIPAGSYACELWSVGYLPISAAGLGKKDLESELRTMLGKIVGVGKRISNDGLFKELGIHSITHQWLKRVVTFWNTMAQLPDTNMFARILKDSCSYGVRTRSPSWAGEVMRALTAIGYPTDIIDCNKAHPVDVEIFNITLRKHHERVWGGLHISPRLAPSLGVHRCTYLRWFAFPPHVGKNRLLYIPISSSKIRLFLKFRMGQHDLPIAKGRLHDPPIPRHQRFCDMCPGSN